MNPRNVLDGVALYVCTVLTLWLCGLHPTAWQAFNVTGALALGLTMHENRARLRIMCIRVYCKLRSKAYVVNPLPDLSVRITIPPDALACQRTLTMHEQVEMVRRLREAQHELSSKQRGLCNVD